MLSIVKIEQLTLKSLLETPDEFQRFHDNYMISEIGKDLFTVIKKLYVEGVSLTDEHIIAEGNKVNKEINQITLNALRNMDNKQESFEYYFKTLKEQYAKHNIEDKLLKDVLTQVSAKGHLNIEKVMELNKSIVDNLAVIEGKESLLISLEQMYLKYLGTLRGRESGDNLYSFGDATLDKRVVMGAAPGHITIVFAATGLGKSAWTFQLVRKQINKKIPCIYISLENDITMTTDRMFSSASKIPVSQLYPDRDGVIEDNIYEELRKEMRKAEKVNRFFFIEEPNLHLSDVRSIIRESKRKMGVDYLIATVDLLSMLKDFSVGLTASLIEEKMNELHELARQENVHIIGVLQANRSADDFVPKTIEQIDRLRPNKSNIKNSSAWAERARLVLALFRPKFYANLYFKDDPEIDLLDDITEVNCLKQNSGELFQIKYLFDPSIFTFFRYEE